MARLNFIPDRDGFHFANSFGNQILPGTPFTFTTGGLCGGMVMAALDYWRSGVPVPTHTTDEFEPFQPPDTDLVPAVGTRLRSYIYTRLMDSLLTKAMFTRWITFPWIGPQQFYDAAVGSEFDLVRSVIDSGRPAMLGLWAMDGAADEGHQVLAYGYDEGPRRLYVYDPNHPDNESVLTPIGPDQGIQIRGGTDNGVPDQYRGYFFTDVYNWDQNPPYQPQYVDLAVTGGWHVDAGQGSVGDPVQASVTVTNMGDYPARFRQLRVWSRDPDGTALDDVLGGPEAGLTHLDPGQQVTLIRKAAAFGTTPGIYQIGVSYLSEQGYVRPLPTRPGTVSQVNLNLYRAAALAVDQWFVVPENANAPVDTGIVIQPGDEVALTGDGQIWAGVWFAGENGPAGWADRMQTNLNAPMHNTLDAHPYALIGRLAAGAWFSIGAGLSRRNLGAAQPQPLQLWINDDIHGNGSGQFRCHVQVWR
jgi:hypothetical protein